MAYHAQLSPSSAHRWTECTASIKAAYGLRDDGSEAARLGTTGHQLSAECLEFGFSPQDYLGKKMVFWADIFGNSGEDWIEHLNIGTDAFSQHHQHTVVVDQDMIDACSAYINFVLQQAELSDATLYIEQRVPIGHITGEEGAGGTSDVVMAATKLLTTIDLKLGRVKVMAYDVITPAGVDIITNEPTPEVLRMNLQLALYLLGSLKKYPGDYTHVKAVIVQPHLHHVSEYSCTVEELLALGEWIKERAEATRTARVFAPSEDNCHYCKAKLTCKAREDAVLSTALVGFDDIDDASPAPIRINHLGSLYDKVGMIQDWCKDVVKRVFSELSLGQPVMRNDGLQYKLVAGKKGDRKFDDEEVVEQMFKSMRLKQDEMYTRKLITPTAAEKLAQPTKQGRKVIAPPILTEIQWAKLEAHITQSPGSPTVALETDPRPAIVISNPEFEDVPEVAPVASNCSDLF